MLELILSTLLLAAPADPSASTSDVRALARPIARVWLLGPGLDQTALAEAVAARLADKQILAAGQAADPADGLAALCHVTSPGAGMLQLEVILSDGRLYQRRIAAPNEGRERAAARLIASTLAAIEDASATPDRRDAVFDPPVAPSPPAILVPPIPPLAPIAESAQSPAPPDIDVSPPITTPTNPSPEIVMTPADDAPEPARTPKPRREPRELGVALELGPSIGLGIPTAGRGLAAGGAGLRVDLRLRRGVTLAAGFRGHARVQGDLALGRFRWGLGVGHTLRRRGLELALLAGPTLETWQVTQRGAAVAYSTSSSSGASLLLGGLARAALGGRLQRRRMSARLGGYLELAGSARSSGRAAQIARKDPEGGTTPVFVLGGAELSLGLEVELWFVLRRR